MTPIYVCLCGRRFEKGFGLRIHQRTCLLAGVRNGGVCQGCQRVMSVREGAEQGMCNDCLGGAL